MPVPRPGLYWARDKTGVGLKLAGALIDLAGGMLLPAMFFTNDYFNHFGMGVPTTANYVITSTLCGPGADPDGGSADGSPYVRVLLWHHCRRDAPGSPGCVCRRRDFGRKSDENRHNCFETGYCRLCNPIHFRSVTGVTHGEYDSRRTDMGFATSVIGMVGLGTAMIGYLMAPANILVRIMAFAGGITLIYPGVYTDMIGFGMLGLVLFIQIAKRKRQDAKAKLAQ